MAKTFTVELTEREMELLSDCMSAYEPLDDNGESDEDVEAELDAIADKLTNTEGK